MSPTATPAGTIDILLIGEAFAAIVNCGVATTRGDTECYRQTREQAITLMEKAVSRRSGSPMTWLFDRLAVST